MAGIRAGPSERLAGLAFLVFTIMQVPYFAVNNTTVKGWPSVVQLSPLQVTAARLATTLPEAEPYAEAILLPGTWLREAVAPLLRCQLGAGGKPELCARERRLLFDFDRVRRRAQLPSLKQLAGGRDVGARAGADALVYGCGLVTLSALLSVYVTVKSSLAGFALVSLGIAQGGHQPLPPGVLVLFLCVYSGFNLGEGREGRGLVRREPARARVLREARRGGGGGGAKAGGEAGGSGSGSGSGGAKEAKPKAKVRKA